MSVEMVRTLALRRDRRPGKQCGRDGNKCESSGHGNTKAPKGWGLCRELQSQHIAKCQQCALFMSLQDSCSFAAAKGGSAREPQRKTLDMRGTEAGATGKSPAKGKKQPASRQRNRG